MNQAYSIGHFIVAVAVVMTIAPLSLRAEGMSLQAAIMRALSEHPRVGAAEAGRAAAQQALRQERSGYYPTFSLSAGAGGVRREDDATRTVAALAGEESDAATDFAQDVRVVLRQPVFDWMATPNRVSAAERRVKARDFAVADAGETIALQAADAFLRLHAARRLRDRAQSLVDAMREYRENVAMLAAEGAGDQTSLARVEALVAGARANLVEAEGRIRAAEADWRQAIGGIPPRVLDPAASALAMPADIEAAVNKVEETNPAVLGALEQAEARGHDVTAARRSLLPRLDAELSYFRDEENADLGGQTIAAEALLRLSWDFSLGGGDLARVAQSAAQREQSVMTWREQQRLAERQARRDVNEYRTAQSTEKLVKDRLAASEKVLRLTEELFEGGQSTLLDLVAVTNEAYQARFRVIEAERRTTLAKLRLLATLGRLRQAVELPPQR